MLAAMAQGVGVAAPLHLHADDRLETIVQSLETTADCDVVLLSGGVSVGSYDMVPQALAEYGAETVFHKVTQKPGKPLLFARRGPQLIFGLPGNPLACHQCFHRYVAAAIRRIDGGKPNPSPHSGKLTAPVRPRQDRTYFLLGRARRAGGAATGWRVEPLLAQSTADVFSVSRANCYVRVEPRGAELPAGTPVSFVWINDKTSLDGETL
jgi:molybdopterin molybdotransferase